MVWASTDVLNYSVDSSERLIDALTKKYEIFYFDSGPITEQNAKLTQIFSEKFFMRSLSQTVWLHEWF